MIFSVHELYFYISMVKVHLKRFIVVFVECVCVM